MQSVSAERWCKQGLLLRELLQVFVDELFFLQVKADIV